MDVGINLPNAGPKATRANIEAVAERAQALGFGSLWVTDHVILAETITSPYPYRDNYLWDYPTDVLWLDPLISLAVASSVAPNLAVGTSVLIGPLRNPVLVAKQVATLDYLTGGRAILGLGAGWNEEEFALVGVPFAERTRRLLEMVGVMRALWTGESIDFEGEYWSLRDARMYPVPVNHKVPILFGGHSDAALRRVAKVADGWLPTQLTLAQLQDGVERLRRYCDEAGRDPDEITVVAWPGKTYELTPESHAAHVELGLDGVIGSTLISDPSVDMLMDTMEEWAEICGLESIG